jgi:hypothetical protein
MKTLRDLQLFQIVHDLPEFKEIDQKYGMESSLNLFDFICSSHKNIAFQSAAMQIGFTLAKKPQKAFEAGAAMLIACKDAGLYELKKSETSMWLTPVLQFEEDEMLLLEEINFETHELPTVVTDNADKILSQFSKHSYPLNYEFLNKINKVPFELDMDVLLNFQGENMPITYNKMTAEYLNKPIFFNWRYDSRGRSYSEGYGLNIQGNKTVRSVLQSKNKELIERIDPVYIALANAKGYDHWTWERRIKWAKEQEVDHTMVIPKRTKYPEKYVKAVRAILDYEEDNLSGFIMESDATASGMQIMACITGCIASAKEVNLVDPKVRKNVYGTVARRMSKHPDVSVTTEDVKYPVMTHYYNSLATPKESFNETELSAFYEALDGLLPGCEFAMKELNKCWNPDAKYHSWTLPDGHVAFVRTMTAKESEYTYDGTAIKYQYYVNEGNRTSFRSLVPNIIHSIDGYIARQMILRAPFELTHVHDCFLYHPNHHWEVCDLYREILAELVTDYNINHIIESITGKFTGHHVNPALGNMILDSSYALS